MHQYLVANCNGWPGHRMDKRLARPVCRSFYKMDKIGRIGRIEENIRGFELSPWFILSFLFDSPRVPFLSAFIRVHPWQKPLFSTKTADNIK
jgi:hypothetical protein